MRVPLRQAGHLPLPNVTVPPGVFFSPLLRLRVSTPQLLHVADMFSMVPAHPPFGGNRRPAARLLLVRTRPVPWRLSLETRFSPLSPTVPFLADLRGSPAPVAFLPPAAICSCEVRIPFSHGARPHLDVSVHKFFLCLFLFLKVLAIWLPSVTLLCSK